MMHTIINVIRSAWGRWLLTALALSIGFELLLVLTLVIRFGELPNYFERYDLIGNYRLIVSGTPDLRDTLQLLAAEPWMEVGYKDPDYYGIAEWSLMLLPAKLLNIFIVSLLLSTSQLLMAAARRLPCPATARRYAFGVSGVGSAMLYLTNVTATWVVCCATPTWVVMFTMLGLSSSVALSIQPFGIALGGMAMVIMLTAILYQARAIALRVQHD